MQRIFEYTLFAKGCPPSSAEVFLAKILMPERDSLFQFFGEKCGLEQMKADIGEFVRRLPHEVRTDSEDPILKAAINGEHTALISQVTDYLTARIAGGDD